jgi:hypothetical protein
MATINAGKAEVTVIGKYKDELTNKSQKAFSKFKAGAVTAMKAAAAAVAIFTAALGALGVRLARSLEQISQMSIRLGISTEALSQFKLVAAVANLDINSFTIGLQRMTRRIAEATTGTGVAVSALKELGLSANELNNQSVDEQFLRVAQALSEVDDQGKRVLLAFKLFDTEGVGLLQSMENGRAGIERLMRSSDEMGLTLTEEGAKSIATMNEAFVRLRLTIEGLVQKELVSLSGSIADFANWLTQSAKPVFDSVVKVFGKLAGVMKVVAGLSLVSAAGFAFLAGEAKLANDLLGAGLELIEKSLKTIFELGPSVHIPLVKNIDKVKESTGQLDDVVRKKFFETMDLEIKKLELISQGLEDQIPLLEATVRLKDALGGSELTPSDFRQIRTRIELQKELNDQIEEQNKIIAAGERIFDAFGDGMVRALQDGRDMWGSFKDAALAALFDIQREMIKMAVFDPVKKAAGSFLQSAGGNILSSIFGGFFADGGGVQGNVPIMVGERGPELFTPGASGRITSNEDLKSRGGSPISINQYFQLGVPASVRAEMQSLKPLWLEEAKAVIAEERSRSLSYSEQMGVA